MAEIKTYKCDFCGLSISDEKFVFHTMKRNTKKIFPHLCESCADKLDYLFEELEKQDLEYIDMVRARHKINELRKTNLNTKG